MVYVLSAILAFITAALSIRLFMLNREMRRLSDLLKTDQRKLTAFAGNAALEALCESVNHSIDGYIETAIAVQNHEARLRASVANISHDLRTPLTAMLGYLALMRSNPEKFAEYAAVVENRAHMLKELVEAFYELSIADDVNHELPLETIDINAILTNCLLGSHTLFEQRGITPIVAVPNAPVYITGNALAYERICQNLLQNALKYALDKVDIKLSKAPGAVLTVSNHAANLTADDVPLLFERFYTADKSRSGPNTGVGLYLVKALTEKMGGRVNAELSEGVFTVRVVM